MRNYKRITEIDTEIKAAEMDKACAFLIFLIPGAGLVLGIFAYIFLIKISNSTIKQLKEERATLV